MDFPAVLATLLDLPPTFTRQTPWFTQLMDSLGAELSIGTVGTDGILAQVQSADTAQDGWLDVWGLLFGIPRTDGEGNAPYLMRLEETLLAWVGTLPAIQVWLNLFAPGGTVADNTNGVGYVITLPASMTPQQISDFLFSLNRIRPAGMPITVLSSVGGLYLGTEEFMGTGRVMGTYLTDGVAALLLPIAPAVNNFMPLLPTLYFEDPTINPSLAPPVPLA